MEIPKHFIAYTADPRTVGCGYVVRKARWFHEEQFCNKQVKYLYLVGFNTSPRCEEHKADSPYIYEVQAKASFK